MLHGSALHRLDQNAAHAAAHILSPVSKSHSSVQGHSSETTPLSCSTNGILAHTDSFSPLAGAAASHGEQLGAGSDADVAVRLRLLQVDIVLGLQDQQLEEPAAGVHAAVPLHQIVQHDLPLASGRCSAARQPPLLLPSCPRQLRLSKHVTCHSRLLSARASYSEDVFHMHVASHAANEPPGALKKSIAAGWFSCYRGRLGSPWTVMRSMQVASSCHE